MIIAVFKVNRNIFILDAALSRLFVPFCKRVYSTRKEFDPSGSKFFHFRVVFFSTRGSVCRKANMKSEALPPMNKTADTAPHGNVLLTYDGTGQQPPAIDLTILNIIAYSIDILIQISPMIAEKTFF